MCASTPAPDAPDVSTLEDIYGDSGNSFQGAFGFVVREGTAFTIPAAGYGVGIDDVVVEWREVARVKDATSCPTGGACATVSTAATQVYEGSVLLEVTVLDASPWDAVHPVNDCNGNGAFTDAGTDDQDCDDDGVLDVTVTATSLAEKPGEVLVLDRTTPGGPAWTGRVPVSTLADQAGVLFVQQEGTAPATVTVRYEDRDDGTDQPCGNDPDPVQHGTVTTSTPLFVDTARIVVKGVRLTDNGDADGFADTNETVSMFLTLANRSLAARDGIVLHLSTNDPKIDCILTPFVAFGSLGDREVREQPVPFVFRVGPGSRVSPDSDYAVTFDVTLSGADFGAGTRPQKVTIELDLDVTGGGGPGSFTEGFESGAFGAFTTMTLDVGKASNTLSNGYRCQYNDPDVWCPGASCSQPCYLGFPTPANNGFDWHVHGTSAPDGGRAYLGSSSLHWGVHSGSAALDTTRLAQLDAIRTSAPIDLGWSGVTSQLSFTHQIGLADCDFVNCDPGETADRGVVHVQLANAAGAAVGVWKKIAPYENLYDAQGTDNYGNCTFDPIDDGNDEDSYFDPMDPNRRLGPSSTCYPEFTFAHVGSTRFDAPFDNSLGHASDGPGLDGSLGPGTWVTSRFDLGRFRGRRLFLRFLTTSIQIAPGVTMEQVLAWNPITADDGWYVDDVVVTNTLATPATVSTDTNSNGGLPACGSVCTTVTADVVAEPPESTAPGQAVTLSAIGSVADRCIGGVLQFQFWRDVNRNGVPGDGGDDLLRPWGDDPTHVDAPYEDTDYGVQVRCSTAPSCMDATDAPGHCHRVDCPDNPATVDPAFGQTIGFGSRTQIAWTSPERVDLVQGDLIALRQTGTFENTVADRCSPQRGCRIHDSIVSSADVVDTPPPGGATYYLVRTAGDLCNTQGTWSAVPVSGKEKGQSLVPRTRDAQLHADPDTCQ